MTGPSDKLQCWLLHSRPFRETSLLLDFLTRDRGRCSVIARGVRNSRSQKRAILQPFIQLQISIAGRNDLKSLKDAEALGCVIPLVGNRLFAALYVNELLSRLMHAYDADSRIYDAYSKLLADLAAGKTLEPVLRGFELDLLEYLGYGLQFAEDAVSGELIQEQAWYGLDLETGFVRQDNSGNNRLIPGQVLLDIQRRDFSNTDTRRMAKQLMRRVLQHHLGEKELISRSLFGTSGNDISGP